MKVSSLFHRTVTTCTWRDTLEHAAELLWRYDIGCLPVLDDSGKVAGMITDRDICIAAFLQGAPLRSITVSSVMAKEVASCDADDNIFAVLRTMIARQLHRLPVIDADRQLVGIVSLNDIARAANAGMLPATEVASVLAVISMQHTSAPPRA